MEFASVTSLRWWSPTEDAEHNDWKVTAESVLFVGIPVCGTVALNLRDATSETGARQCGPPVRNRRLKQLTLETAVAHSHAAKKLAEASL